MMETVSLVLFGGALIVGVLTLLQKRFRGVLNTNSDAITVVLSLIAGAYVLVEYQLNQAEQRRDRTRSYIERIESGTIHDAKQWFDGYWINNRELIKKIEAANYGPNADMILSQSLTAEYMKGFNENDRDDQGIQNMMRLFYFYSDLSKCVELEICDAETACEMFADDIGRFYVLHADFVSRWREVAFERNFVAIKRFLNEDCSAG